MNTPGPESHKPPELELELLLQQMLKEQIELGENISSTSQFLKFVLGLANENLTVIKTQLERIRELASAIDDCDCA